MKLKSVYLQSKSTSSSEGKNGDNNNNSSSCYYPGCKKDANCNCEICLDSINATLDLMPLTIHKNSLTKLSVTRPNVHCTPITFDASILSTPTSSKTSDWPYQIPPTTTTPDVKSSVRSSDFTQKMKKQSKGSQKWSFFSEINLLRILFGLVLLLSAEIVFSRIVSGIFQPALSPDFVKRVGEKCYNVQGFNGKLRFLQRELTSAIVHGKVSNCSFTNSLWEINQDGLLLNSRCTLYKSAIEKVTIWGWPLQTAGLLTNGFSLRTQTILSGRVTEWNGGQVGYLTRKANTSWVQLKWGASVVQLDPNTWVLEYQRSSIVDDPRLYSAVLEFFKYWISRVIGRVKKKLWLLAAFEDRHYNGLIANNGLKIPT